MKLFFALLFSIVIVPVFAQSSNTVIQGVLVQSGSGQPIEGASVALLRQADNTLAEGNISEENGSFRIEHAGTGAYRLRVSGLGFAEKIIGAVLITNTDTTINLGTILMEKSETSLKVVEVVGEKSLLEMGIDKKTFNVEKNITSSGGTAADVLQNIPSVSVDAAGGVSLRGKSSVTILIDGKPATLLAGDVASALQALPAASIESVEVVTNPSAKYDAQGSNGIINIITKTNKNAGLNGSATLGIGTRGKYNGGLNLNLRRNKWNFAVNSNFRISDNYQRNTTDRKNSGNDSGSYTYGDYQRLFNGWFNSLTIGYTIDTQNTVSLTQNYNVMHFGSEGSQEFDLFSAPGILYSIQERTEKFGGYPKSSSSNVSWKHKFHKPKQELTADATYSFSNTDVRQTLRSNMLDGERNYLYGPIAQDIPSQNSNSNFNAQADFTTPFLTKEGKLDAGLKTQNFWFSSQNAPTRTLPGDIPVTDSVLLNSYDYNQHTHAAYTSYTDKIKKWSYQGGLRLEYATYSGTAGSVGNLSYSNTFLNLFPSAYLAYQLKDNQQLYLNYSRRTDRPFFLRLLPYLNIANALDTNSGNPDLKPEFIDNFEFSYSLQLPKGNSILASLYYQHTQNLIQNYTRTYADGTSFTQPVNLSSASTYGLELTAKTQITKAWDATISGNFFQNRIDGANVDPSVSNEGFSWFSKVNTNYKITKQVSLQLMGNYESAKPEAQGRRQEVYWMDAAIKANFLKNNKASVTLNVTDIFNTRKYTTNYNLPLYSQRIYRDRETQIATITFTYKFGKTEFDSKRPGKRSRSAGEVQKKELKERDGNLKSGEDDNNAGGGPQK
jgi:outer membrane receptor protein involved in Fe transport